MPAAERPVLVPAPTEVRWSGGEPATLADGQVAIVLGRAAVAPEEEGARLLQESVRQRFGRQWPIVREGDEPVGARTLVVIGQRSTSPLLDAACREHRIELSGDSPGHDGYIIAPVRERDRLVVLIGGSNARGAMYGQDTFAQMLRRTGDALIFVPGTVRDAPVVRWRGRPQTKVRHYLPPGELDL
jgi:hypothetical protein